MSPWFSVFSAILGVIIGGIVSHIANIRRTNYEKRWHRDENILVKLEELYTLIEEVKNGFFSGFSDATIKLHTGEAFKFEGKIPLERLSMLINFYTPEADSILSQLMSSRQAYSTTLAEIISSRDSRKSEKQQLCADLLCRYQAIEKDC